jgi:heme-degrading monooxygenase HmoA
MKAAGGLRGGGEGFSTRTRMGRMWLNSTYSRVKPAYMGRVLSILEGEASLRPLQAARGFCGLFLIESMEAAGEIVSITWWDSAEEGQAYLASPECRGVIESIQEFLVSPLERSYYRVLIEASSPKESRGGS